MNSSIGSLAAAAARQGFMTRSKSLKLQLASVVALFAVAAPVQASWREASTDHFIIYSEQSEPALKEFAGRLERYDAAMRLTRGVPDVPLGPANRVTVYVVRDVTTVQKLFGQGAKNGQYQIAGFYMPRATGSVAITPRSIGENGQFDMDADIVLLHEYAHHFMMQHYAAAFPGNESKKYRAGFSIDGLVKNRQNRSLL